MNIEIEKLIRVKASADSTRFAISQPIYKEDYGLYLFIEGLDLPEVYTVDFSESETNGTSVPMLGNADGVLIPQQFIKSGKNIYAFLYLVGTEVGKTVYKFRIPNKCRPDRTNEEPTPEEQSVIDQTISALNDAVDRAEDAEQAIENMSVSATTLAEGSSATVTKTETDGVVHLEFGIPRGATGAQGERGEKGDKGDTGAQGIQGERGERGLQGIQGPKGDKGDTGEKGDTGATGPKGETGATGPKGDKGDKGDTGAQGIQGPKGDKGDTGEQGPKGDTGATGAKGEQGERGLTGADGISPTVTITPITGGHRITITDADGEHSTDVMDGDDYTLTAQDKQDIAELVDVPVDDVQINGTSIVEDGVANVPLASESVHGATKYATASEIKSGGGTARSINPYRQHESTFYGLAKASGDTTQRQSSNAVGTYTEEAKVAIQKMLGIYQAPWELIREDTFTNAEEADHIISTDANGETFELTDAVLELIVPTHDEDTVIADYLRVYFSEQNVVVATAFLGNNPTKTITANSAVNMAIASVTQNNGLMCIEMSQWMTRTNRNNKQILMEEGLGSTAPYRIKKAAIDSIKIGKITGFMKYRIYGRRKWQ